MIINNEEAIENAIKLLLRFMRIRYLGTHVYKYLHYRYLREGSIKLGYELFRGKGVQLITLDEYY